MKTEENKRWAFTLIELTAVLAITGVLALAALPVLCRTKAASTRITCADNLKQIGIACKTYANNNSSRYPMSVPASQGGPPNQSMFTSSSGSYGAYYECQVFSVLSNQLSTPKLLICPSDEKTPFTNFSTSVNLMNSANSRPLNNGDLSYFLGKDATTANPQMLLCGDRNIYGYAPGSTSLPSTIPNAGYGNSFYNSTTGTCIAMGTNFVTGAATPCWTPAKVHQSKGNVLLSDGSVQQLDNTHLRLILSQSADTESTATSPGLNSLFFP